MNKKYLLSVFIVVTVLSVVFFKNPVFAFEANGASPNEMSVQDSREIYQQKQITGVLLVAVPIVTIGVVVFALKARKKVKTSKSKKAPKK